jgi:hypothetical protein
MRLEQLPNYIVGRLLLEKYFVNGGWIDQINNAELALFISFFPQKQNIETFLEAKLAEICKELLPLQKYPQINYLVLMIE